MKKNKFNSSSFLISGGTGSFGYNMVKKLINLNAKRIIIFSRDEKKQFDMRNELMSKNLTLERLEHVLETGKYLRN